MKILTILALALTLNASTLQAEENYLGAYDISTENEILNDKYCQKTYDNQSLCMEYQLDYPSKIKSSNPALNDTIQKKIAPYRESFKIGDAKKYIVKFLKEGEFDASGTWSQETTVALFATTEKTFTLAITNGGYMGGAHGNYATGYDNFESESGKKLTLKDLLVEGYKSKLTHIAKTYYMKLNNLKPNESLTNLGWFDNKFVLAENVAITPKGLFFLYNSYEIKPYSSGQTTFLLPYDKLTPLVKPDSVFMDITKKVISEKHTAHTYSFSDDYGAKTTIQTTITPQHTLHVVVKMKNLSYKKRGWLSVSFPDIHNTNIKPKISQQGFTSLHSYPKGSKIYNQTLKKAIKSDYLLVEAESKNWKEKKENTIDITLDLPKNTDDFFIHVRGSFRDKGKNITLVPNADDGIKGQQGYSNYRIGVGL